MKKSPIILVILLQFFNAVAVVPRPDHVVILLLENHSYDQIIGSADAPYINSLLPYAANMQQYYGLTHPSQPNYIMLFSGNNQGETTNNMPYGTPWTTPNLGASLLDSGFTFAGFAEDLPAPGSLIANAGAYGRKHCPWINWQGTGPNQIPPTCNLQFSQFPVNYTLLPDVSFVIPNQDNDMHNGTDPQRITTADQWIQNNLSAYINWAQTNNSLFILTFDEDNYASMNRIPCLIIGQMVQPGNYGLYTYHHYDLLRTIEEMFGLPQSGNSAFARPITEIWIDGDSTEAESGEGVITHFAAAGRKYININFNVQEDSGKDALLVLTGPEGNVLSERKIHIRSGFNSELFSRQGVPSGVYSYELREGKTVIAGGKVRLP